MNKHNQPTQSKYSSLSTFIIGVAKVREPLTDGEKIILGSLAAHGDYRTGESRPGNGALIEESGRSLRGVQDLLKYLRDKRLTEIVEVGNGRSTATIHRIRIEDPRFPAPAPKTVKESDTKVHGRKRKNHADSTAGLTEGNHADVSAGLVVENRAVEDGKPCSNLVETMQQQGGNHADSTAPLPRTTSKEHPNLPPPTMRQAAGKLAKIFGQKTKKTLTGGDGPRNQKLVAQAIEIAPPGSVMKLFEKWIDQRIATDSLEGLRFPVGVFVAELPGLIAADDNSPERTYTKEELEEQKENYTQFVREQEEWEAQRKAELEADAKASGLTAEDLFGSGD
jgi:hypothetical protein